MRLLQGGNASVNAPVVSAPRAEKSASVRCSFVISKTPQPSQDIEKDVWLPTLINPFLFVQLMMHKVHSRAKKLRQVKTIKGFFFCLMTSHPAGGSATAASQRQFKLCLFTLSMRRHSLPSTPALTKTKRLAPQSQCLKIFPHAVSFSVLLSTHSLTHSLTQPVVSYLDRNSQARQAHSPQPSGC